MPNGETVGTVASDVEACAGARSGQSMSRERRESIQ